MIPQETMNSDEIYEDLCNKIEKLVYLPGDKISEMSFAGSTESPGISSGLSSAG